MSSYLSRPRSLEQALGESDAAFKMQAVVPETFQGLLAGDPLAGIQGRDVTLSDVTGREHGTVANVAFEALADPSMIYGPVKAMVQQSARFIKNPGRTYADITSGLSNYIEGFYGGGSGKQSAVLSWLPAQLENVISHFSPKGLKTLDETGMSAPLIDMTANLLKAYKAGDSKAIRKAYAQVQHGAYMLYRGGTDVTDMPPLYQRMIKSMSLNNKGFQPYNKEQYVKEATEIVKKTGTGGKSRTQANPSVVGGLFDRASEAWGVGSGKTAKGKPMDMIIRTSGSLGDFSSDVSHNSMANMLEKVFQGEGGSFDNTVDLMEAISKHLRSAEGMKKGVGTVTKLENPPKVVDLARKRIVNGKEVKKRVEGEGNPYVVTDLKIGDDGVYFNFKGTTVKNGKGQEYHELASNSYLEGGVNMQVHVDKNGNVTAIISDTYDFYEKQIPITEKVLDRGIWGVTAPIIVNVNKRGSKQQVSNTFDRPASVEGDLTSGYFDRGALEEIAAKGVEGSASDVAYRAAMGDLLQRNLIPTMDEEFKSNPENRKDGMLQLPPSALYGL